MMKNRKRYITDEDFLRLQKDIDIIRNEISTSAKRYEEVKDFKSYGISETVVTLLDSLIEKYFIQK